MKKQIYLITLSLFIISFLKTYAQNYTLYGDKTYGSVSNEFFPIIAKTDSIGIILCGYTSGTSGDITQPPCDSGMLSGTNIWLLKVDTGLSIVWDKSYGGKNGDGITLPLIKKNNQILLSCNSSSDSACDKLSHSRAFPALSLDYWMLNLDTIGNQNFQYSYGGIGSDYYPQTIELSSGNLITCGGSQSFAGADKSDSGFISTGGLVPEDYWVIKTDSLGNKLWDKCYGGNGQEYYTFSSIYDKRFFILDVENDNFIIAGTTDSPPSFYITDTSKGAIDVWIIKLDSAGNRIWDKRFGGVGADICNHIIHTNDNGFLLCGFTSSPQGGDVSDTSRGLQDCWVIKLDSLGNKQWDKRYGGNFNDTGTWILKAPGGGYWISGNSSSDMSGEVSEPRYASSGLRDFWIFKIDENGNKLWDKRFGSTGGNSGSSFVVMPDASIYIAGSSFTGSNSVKTDIGKGGWDFWVVHFKYIDSLTTSGIYNQSYFNANLSVYPNPAKDLVTITSTTESIKAVELVNLLGETLLIQKVNNAKTTQINLQTYPTGFYYVKITGANYSITKKVLRQ